MTYPFAQFDQSGIPPVGVVEGYAIWSRNYDEMLTDNLDGPILKSFAPHLSETDIDVVDLGCGTGRTGSWLRGNVAVRSLDGIDVSGDMLAIAEAKGLYDTLRCEDMTATGLAPGSYDLAVNVLSACHVPDLARLYKEARRLLRSGGMLLLADYHPHMLLSGNGTCFPSAQGGMVAVENHVHNLRDHTRIAGELGFQYVAFEESLVTQEWLDQGLEREQYLHHPIGFGFLWREGRNPRVQSGAASRVDGRDDG